MRPGCGTASKKSTIYTFSKKKIWTVDQAQKSRNVQCLACQAEDIPPIVGPKHPASSMIPGVIATDWQPMPHPWFDCSLTSVQMTAWESPACTSMVHKAVSVYKKTASHLIRLHAQKTGEQWEVGTCCGNGWCGHLQVHISLYPLGYGIWGIIGGRPLLLRTYCCIPEGVEEEWEEILKDYVVMMCRASFRPRLEAMQGRNKAHFEEFEFNIVKTCSKISVEVRHKMSLI